MRVLFAVLLLTWLAGCGQKGPLYLPEESEQESTESVNQ
ncbi:LPS translocon maturation chaperone LptM [Spartinivicinus ruber]|nr:lipoprotein [Spartinivicinus ruber]